MRARIRIATFVLCLLVPAAAFAAAPPAKETVDPDPAAQAGEAAKVQGLAKAAEARENAAGKSIEDMLKKAGQAGRPGQQVQPVPGTGGAAPTGPARKAIYGDIIIHK